MMFAFFVGYTIHIYSHVIYIDFWLVHIKSSLPTVAERDTSPKTRKVRTTGQLHIGASGGVWAELDVTAGEKKGAAGAGRVEKVG